MLSLTSYFGGFGGHTGIPDNGSYTVVCVNYSVPEETLKISYG